MLFNTQRAATKRTAKLGLRATLWLLCLMLASCGQPQQRTIVVIGDGSAEDKQIGESIGLGAQVEATYLGSLPDGTKLTIRFEDDAENDEIAQRKALRAVSDPSVLAVIGHSASGTSSAAIEIYGPEGMPLLMPVATNPDLTSSAKQRGWTNVLRLVPSDDLQASRIAQFCRNYLSASNAVVVHDAKRYSVTLSESVFRALSEQRVNVAAQIALELYVSPDTQYTSQVRDIKEYSPDVVIFSGYYPQGDPLIQELRSAGFRKPIILTDGCFPTGIFSELGPDPGDVYVCFVAPDWSLSTNAAPLIQDIHNLRPAADVSYAPFAADAVRLINQAATDLLVHSKLVNRRTILPQLREVNPSDKDFIAGPYRFDDAGENNLGRNYLYHLELNKNGERIWKMCLEKKADASQ